MADIVERLRENAARFHPKDFLHEAADEIERLRRDCAELYQVIGNMAEHCPDPEDPAIIKALDNASDAANADPRRHDDLLPFILPAPLHIHKGGDVRDAFLRHKEQHPEPTKEEDMSPLQRRMQSEGMPKRIKREQTR